MLVRPDNGGIDHDVLKVGLFGQLPEQALP